MEGGSRVQCLFAAILCQISYTLTIPYTGYPEQIRTENEVVQTKGHSSWSNYGTEQPQQGDRSGRCKDSRKPERNKGTTATTEASSQSFA
jgi:hypothetical protein